MLSLLLIIIYTTILIFCLIKITRSYRNYLSARQASLSFLIKIVFGLAYGYLFLKFYNGDDTWLYQNLSLIEYQNLLHHPGKFFMNVGNGIPGNAGINSFYDTKNSFWNNLDDVILIKLFAIFNVFSFGHYAVNVVLFCFLVSLGSLLLYRLLIAYFPGSSLLLKLAIFYNPMTIFWLSGLRKEGLLFLALALVLFYFNHLMSKQRHLIVSILFSLLGLSLLLFMRNLVFMCLVPSLIAWSIHRFFKLKALIIFPAVYTGCIIIFFSGGMIPGLPDLADKVTQRQYNYLNLVANTRLPLDSLRGTASSYLHVLPQAINHSFLRPYITEAKGMLQVISAADIYLFFLSACLAVRFRNDDWKKMLQQPILLTCLYTSLFAYLVIGYTVPYPGTFIRYKAIFELLFLCVFAAITDLKKVPISSINKNDILYLLEKYFRKI